MSSQQPTVSIIGIGDDGLDAVPESTRTLIMEAELLAGNPRSLALVPETSAKRITLESEIESIVQQIESSGAAKVAVLVTGDPLFYGLARFLCERLGHDRCEIVPHVSSMQLAFARVKESWDEAYLTNLANHSLDTVVERIRTAEKVGLFTTEEYSPSEVCKALQARNIDYFTVYVCENLGARNECVTQGSVDEIVEHSFDSLNVMVLIRDTEAPDRPRTPYGKSLFGNPDEVFVQSTPKYGLLTSAEVRAMAIAQMGLDTWNVVWDVGAGCGSVSVEVAQLVPSGRVYAIEQDAEDSQLIHENAARFGVSNVEVVHGTAPEAWTKLPDPDAVFLEGSGREVVRIAELAFQRVQPGGRLVANLISIGALEELRQALSKSSTQVQVWMINVARGTDQLERLKFDALNPTFLIAATK